MTSNREPTSAEAAPEGGDFGPLGPPHLMQDESAAGYDAVLAHVSRTVKPVDIIEQFWVRDVVDLIWEAQRLRRLRTDLMQVTAQAGLAWALKPFIYSDVQPGQGVKDLPLEGELAAGFAAGEPAAVERTHKLLRPTGQSTRAVTVKAVAGRMDEIERIDRMIAAAENRRMVTLREIRRYAIDNSPRRPGPLDTSPESQGGHLAIHPLRNFLLSL